MRRESRAIPAWQLMVSLGLTGLAACSGLHPAPSATNTAPPAAQAPEQPEPNMPASAGEDAAPSDGPVAGIPDCVPPVAKLKTKPKPKPRTVPKEAPPQLPTAPVVAEAPADAVVNAQVRPMPVSVMSILGKQVRGPHGDDLGRVVDVLADASGRVRVAIIDFGGFLGVGDKRIAVDWPLLRFNPDRNDSSLLLSVDRDRLKAAPEYKDILKPQTLMEPAPTSAPSVETK